MNTPTEIYTAAVTLWGKDKQTAMLEEESIELALAVHKFLNRKKDKQRLKEMAGEIADVLNVIDQIYLMYPETVPIIEEIRHEKLMRLKRRIEEKDFEFKG